MEKLAYAKLAELGYEFKDGQWVDISTLPDAEGWITNPGYMPVDYGTPIDCVFRGDDGETIMIKNIPAGLGEYDGDRDNDYWGAYNWNVSGDYGDIIKYRPHQGAQ